MDVILTMKMLVLQSLYGLSDPELERHEINRISFRKFLGFPEKILDQTAVWYSRERLIKTRSERAIRRKLQWYLDAKGLKIWRGIVQNATFITTDPGHAPVDPPGREGVNPEEKRTIPGQRRVRIRISVQAPHEGGLRPRTDPYTQNHHRLTS